MDQETDPREQDVTIEVPPGTERAVASAMMELARNPLANAEIIRRLAGIDVPSGDAVSGEGLDRRISPEIQAILEALRDGGSTSEYSFYKAVSRILTMVAVFSPVIEAVLALVEARMGETPSFGASLVVTVASVTLKTVMAERYMKSRSSIKEAAIGAILSSRTDVPELSRVKALLELGLSASNQSKEKE